MCEALGAHAQRHERIQVDSLLLRRLTEKGGPLEEVVLVAYRPDGRVLLHTKRFYPEGVWRLPSGRLKEGELPEAAVRREVKEELGLVGVPERLLGRLTCLLEAEESSLSFTSWVFALAIGDRVPAVQDREEEIVGFRWVPVEELGAVAERLEALPPPWRGWGTFRGAAHRFVMELLAGKDGVTEGRGP